MIWVSGKRIALLALLLLIGIGCGSPAARLAADDKASAPAQAAQAAQDWPMLGGTIQRNMVNLNAKNILGTWSVAKGKEQNIKWLVPLGSMSYGGPTIAGGKIFIGTNNDRPRDPAIKGDKGILLCLRQSDGKFLWQAVHDKLDEPEENDFPKHGVASTPAVDGNRVYYLSNRCELVCADVEGDQATGKAKFLWTLDLIKDLGVYPCYLANNSPLVIGNLVFTMTANGVRPNTTKVIAPKAPSLVAVNKMTGKVVWQDNSPGAKILDGQWSSPVAAEVNGVMQVIYGGGDGWLRGFEATTGKLIWKFDCNPKKSVYKPGGRGDRNLIIAVPVVHDNKLFVALGDEPENAGPGVSHLWCVDISKKPANKDLDLSPVNDNFDPRAAVNKDSGLVWHYGGEVLPKPEDGREYYFGRSISTACVVDGLLYIAEMEGFVHCLDAKTGKKYWEYDFKGETWNSPYYADGKVFVGTKTDMLVFTHGKELKEPNKIDMLNPLETPPVALDGILYVNTGTTLYAIAPSK